MLVVYFSNTGLGQLYIIPMRQKAIPAGLITKEQCDTLFFQVMDIMQFNKELLRKLEMRLQTWNVDKCIGDIFVDCVSAWKVAVVAS
jgi:hypothetical protein